MNFYKINLTEFKERDLMPTQCNRGEQFLQILSYRTPEILP